MLTVTITCMNHLKIASVIAATLCILNSESEILLHVNQRELCCAGWHLNSYKIIHASCSVLLIV